MRAAPPALPAELRRPHERIHQDDQQDQQLANARVAEADAPSHHHNRSKPRELLAISKGGSSASPRSQSEPRRLANLGDAHRASPATPPPHARTARQCPSDKAPQQSRSEAKVCSSPNLPLPPDRSLYSSTPPLPSVCFPVHVAKKELWFFLFLSGLNPKGPHTCGISKLYYLYVC
jgi:hypothetical protein